MKGSSQVMSFLLRQIHSKIKLYHYSAKSPRYSRQNEAKHKLRSSTGIGEHPRQINNLPVILTKEWIYKLFDCLPNTAFQTEITTEYKIIILCGTCA